MPTSPAATRVCGPAHTVPAGSATGEDAREDDRGFTGEATAATARLPADLDAAFRKFIPPFGAAGNP
ncbi:hypothetical protein, partial [Streptomyces sp. NPDC060198]|uniref:hypothetical protein n=1 Tax=Streptomyces sp. NPDC060198 TaxID=3347070 RepID=UPI003668710C